MAAYLIRRFLLMLLTLFGISVLIFVLLRIVPGNIADILFSSAGMINPADKAQIEKELGLDQPIVIQYVQWIGGLAAAAISATPTSPRSRPCRKSSPRLPISAKLAGMALLFAILFGIPLGVISAVRQNTPLDYVLRVVSASAACRCRRSGSGC